jgi:hypothetical protein
MIRLRCCAATAGQAVRLAALAQGRARRIFVAALTTVFVAIAGSERLLACPMCFGAEETSMINGTRLGIVAMLVITFAVQGGFLAFFLYLRRSAKRNAELELDDEWSELQRSPRTR